MAAVVNGEGITQDEYYKYLELKQQVTIMVNPSQLQATGAGQLPQQPYSGRVIGSLGFQALNDLIQQTVLRQLAKDENAYPTDQEIKDELDDRTKTNPGYVKELTNGGMSIDMIRRDVAMSLAQFKLTTKGINVSDDEVNDFIAKNPKAFVIPESVEMIWILVQNEADRAAVDNELKAGQPFIVVAQKYSKAPNARAQGYRFSAGPTPVTQLAMMGPDLLPAVKKTPELGQTGWIKFTEGLAKFYINKKTPERKMPITDLVRKQVKRTLMLQKGAQGKDVPTRVQEKLRTSKIEIMIEHLREPWQQQMEQLKSAATTSTTPVAPGK